MYLWSILVVTLCCLVLVWCVDVDFQAACQAVTSKKRAMHRGSCFIVEEVTGIDGDSAASYCTHLDAKYRPRNGQPQLAVYTGQTGLEAFLINALGFWFSEPSNVWIAPRRLAAPVAHPNAGFDEWYIKFNDIQYGPIVPPDHLDFWLPTYPRLNGQCCTLHRNIAVYGSDFHGGLDKPCTGFNHYPLCEYRSRRRVYRQVLLDKRAVSGLVLTNTTYNHGIDCAHACGNNWVCASFAYNEMTKDCYLQFTDSTVSAAKLLTYFESAPGYRMYEVEDTFEVTLN